MRKALLVINILGGIAVLGSYAFEMLSRPELTNEMWGQLPLWIRPFYQINMLLAALGYFLFTIPLLFKGDPENDRFVLGWDYRFVLISYLLMLAPSAIWMPMTARYLASPSIALWWGIRIVLFLVAVGSVGLFVAIASRRPRFARPVRALGTAGALAFCLQTVVLDAFVWPALF